VTAAALAATLGLAAACWVIAAWQMSGMDMGVATRLGPFGVFTGVWVAMMAAMMLPGAVPAAVRRARASGRVRAVPLFVGSYLAVWAVVGVAVYALMSLTWMAVIAVLAVAQKLRPAKAAVDVPLALAIVGFGIWIAVAPSSVPGLVPPM